MDKTYIVVSATSHKALSAKVNAHIQVNSGEPLGGVTKEGGLFFQAMMADLTDFEDVENEDG